MSELLDTPDEPPDPTRRIRWVRVILSGIVLGLTGVAIGWVLAPATPQAQPPANAAGRN